MMVEGIGPNLSEPMRDDVEGRVRSYHSRSYPLIWFNVAAVASGLSNLRGRNATRKEKGLLGASVR